MKTKYIDLHMHTKYSDGQLDPTQIIKISTMKGIDVMAIADHDHTRGYFEAYKTAEQYGVKLLPAAEITTQNYHLLALNFNPENSKLQKFLKHSRDIQYTRCKTRVDILQKSGLPITMEKIRSEYPDSRIGKGNIKEIFYKDKECREYIQEKHSELSPERLFKYYLGKKGIAGDLKPRIGVDPKEAIDIVHEAGGIIGIAHPPKDIKRMKELEILVEQGIDFLEVQPLFKEKYPYHKFETFAKENNLPISYGSDYHGPATQRELLSKGENILSKDLAKLLKLS